MFSGTGRSWKWKQIIMNLKQKRRLRLGRDTPLNYQTVWTPRILAALTQLQKWLPLKKASLMKLYNEDCQNKHITKPSQPNHIWSKFSSAMKTASIFLGIILSLLLFLNFCFAAEENVAELHFAQGTLLTF